MAEQTVSTTAGASPGAASDSGVAYMPDSAGASAAKAVKTVDSLPKPQSTIRTTDQRAPESSPRVQRTSGSVGRTRGCLEGYRYYKGECTSCDDIASAGNVGFAVSSVFYVMGSVAAAVGPFIYTEQGYSRDEPSGPSYSSSISDTIARYSYDETNSLFLNGYLSVAHACPGAISQFAKLKQVATIRRLGQRNPGGAMLYAFGVLLYAASTTSTILTGLSFSENDQNLSRQYCRINTGILAGSLIVNIATYSIQRRILKKAAFEDVPNDRTSIRVCPFLLAGEDRVWGGIHVAL